MRRLFPLLALPLLALGCDERPKAPPLQTGPVYDNPQLGLRFLAPNNWIQIARTDNPPDTPGEHVVARFQPPPGTSRAQFEVSIEQKPVSDDVATLVRQGSHGAASWEPADPPQPLTIDGAEATRYTLKSKTTTKEVVAARRGRRLFLFTLIAPTSDGKAREEIRQAINGVTWTK